MTFHSLLVCLITGVLTLACRGPRDNSGRSTPGFTLIETERFVFNSFVDCNIC